VAYPQQPKEKAIGLMHVYAYDDDQEMYFRDDLIGLVTAGQIQLFRIKERFEAPSQGIIDRYTVGKDSGPYYIQDDTRVFYVLEEIGTAPNTEEGIDGLLDKAK
jgi:hypothetical protein